MLDCDEMGLWKFDDEFQSLQQLVWWNESVKFDDNANVCRRLVWLNVSVQFDDDRMPKVDMYVVWWNASVKFVDKNKYLEAVLMKFVWLVEWRMAKSEGSWSDKIRSDFWRIFLLSHKTFCFIRHA